MRTPCPASIVPVASWLTRASSAMNALVLAVTTFTVPLTLTPTEPAPTAKPSVLMSSLLVAVATPHLHVRGDVALAAKARVARRIVCRLRRHAGDLACVRRRQRDRCGVLAVVAQALEVRGAAIGRERRRREATRVDARRVVALACDLRVAAEIGLGRLVDHGYRGL